MDPERGRETVRRIQRGAARRSGGSRIWAAGGPREVRAETGSDKGGGGGKSHPIGGQG